VPRVPSPPEGAALRRAHQKTPFVSKVRTRWSLTTCTTLFGTRRSESTVDQVVWYCHFTEKHATLLCAVWCADVWMFPSHHCQRLRTMHIYLHTSCSPWPVLSSYERSLFHSVAWYVREGWSSRRFHYYYAHILIIGLCTYVMTNTIMHIL
jgi:hypothetical protein